MKTHFPERWSFSKSLVLVHVLILKLYIFVTIKYLFTVSISLYSIPCQYVQPLPDPSYNQLSHSCSFSFTVSPVNSPFQIPSISSSNNNLLLNGFDDFITGDVSSTEVCISNSKFCVTADSLFYIKVQGSKILSNERLSSYHIIDYCKKKARF